VSFLKSLNQFVSLFVDTLRMAGRGKIWLVFLVYFLLNWLLLYAHYDFLSPVFYSFISAWTTLTSETNAIVFSHYPGHYLLLPHYFGLAKLVLGLLLEGLILGGVAIYFRNYFLRTGRKDSLSFGSAVSSWVNLSLAWLTINALTVAVTMFFPDWLEFFHDNSPRRLLAMEFAIIPTALAVILALFYFAIPSIAIFRDNYFRGIGRSLSIFARRPITCFFLSAVILAGPFLMSTLVGRSGDIISRFRPEMVYWFLVASLGIEMLANFFWVGTAVRFLLEDEIE
jgi:hypothetical protein